MQNEQSLTVIAYWIIIICSVVEDKCVLYSFYLVILWSYSAMS